VRLTARQLGVPIALKEYPLHAGETRKPDFLAKNPNGRVPMLEFEDGRTLPESDAIIWYLAEGTKLAPESRWDRAQALQWMFFEQYSHEPYIAVARFWLKFAAKEDLAKKQHLVAEWHDKGNAALGVMNTHLKTHDWFGGARYSIADIALYGYTHSAADGGFDLAEYSAVTKWLARVASQPGHVPLDESW
jgi:glutathione S-transferase